ncbi:hypothetical protein ABZ611_31860 [Streptomyces sp. NPDC007861]|uniref:hypothetical protein n=1 Tax=Streptomyces sp. NPDC007861 TaxID=3154893 RepID=UPI0033E609C7
MNVREARERMLSALREKPEGLTRGEIQKRFPELTYDRVDRLLRYLYHRYLVGLDLVTNPGQARWVA